jgi:hypothetical protein
VQRIYRYRRGTPSIEFHGRGGTVFDEAFDLVAGQCERGIPGKHLVRGASAVIILTDGGLSSLPTENPMGLPVLWALTPGAAPPTNWGEVIHLEIQEHAVEA